MVFGMPSFFYKAARGVKFIVLIKLFQKGVNMPRPEKIRVLYLEDDEDSRNMVSFLLDMSGIEVIAAITTEQAWQLATTRYFDLYLLDGLLPSGDSLSLCRDLREHAPMTPILFYSALGFPTDVENGIAAGANDYLIKPYSGDLPEVIFQAIRNSSLYPVAYLQQPKVEKKNFKKVLYAARTNGPVRYSEALIFDNTL